MSREKDTYSIRQVVELTGASEFLLRAWESRYSSLVPRRTKTGRRIYSSNDVLRARALMELTNCNYRVGAVAKLSLSELLKLLEERPVAQTPTNTQSPIVLKILSFAAVYKWDDVCRAISREAKNLSIPQAIHLFFLPLIAEMNQLIADRRFSIAQEHIMTAQIKECLASMPEEKKRRSRSSRFVFATPEGDYHDLGLMMAFRLTRSAGLNALLLGPNVPKVDLSEACLHYNATHLVLSSCATPENGAKEDLFQYVNFLDRNLDSSIRFWLAGPNPKCQSLSLRRSHKAFLSFEVFDKELKNA